MKAKIFEINYYDQEFEKEYGDSSVSTRVVQYQDQEVLDSLIDSDELITDSKDITIKFDYPLTKSTTFNFNREGGFTRKDLFRAIYEGYNYIYLSEEDPGMTPGTLNRARSEGQFGIWGHVIEDLFIEGVVKINKNTFELLMGS